MLCPFSYSLNVLEMRSQDKDYPHTPLLPPSFHHRHGILWKVLFERRKRFVESQDEKELVSGSAELFFMKFLQHACEKSTQNFFPLLILVIILFSSENESFRVKLFSQWKQKVLLMFFSLESNFNPHWLRLSRSQVVKELLLFFLFIFFSVFVTNLISFVRDIEKPRRKVEPVAKEKIFFLFISFSLFFFLEQVEKFYAS